MKNQQIKTLLTKLNQGKLKEQVFARKLKDNVEIGYYWEDIPKPTMSVSAYDGPYDFFFKKMMQEITLGPYLICGKICNGIFCIPLERKAT